MLESDQTPDIDDPRKEAAPNPPVLPVVSFYDEIVDADTPSELMDAIMASPGVPSSTLAVISSEKSDRFTGLSAFECTRALGCDEAGDPPRLNWQSEPFTLKDLGLAAAMADKLTTPRYVPEVEVLRIRRRSMQQYIGTKIINAKPMTRGEYNAFRGWECPADENPAEEGFLVEYVDGGKANTSEYAGYASWSPKDVFEKAYRPVSGMTFGQAIEALKRGDAVARAGWNGKNMCISLRKGSVDGDLLGFPPGEHPVPNHPTTIDGVPLGLYDRGLAGTVTRLPNIRMKTATGSCVEGWLASQADMLAEDWFILP